MGKQRIFQDEIPQELIDRAIPVRLQSIKEKVFGDRSSVYKFWSGDCWAYSTYINNPFIDDLMLELFKKIED